MRRRRANTVYAGTELGDIQIHIQDALLRPDKLDDKCQPGFYGFAHEMLVRPQKQVLGYLLAYGAGPAPADVAPALLPGLADLLPVQPVVIPEALVFGSDDGPCQMFGNLFVVDPLLAKVDRPGLRL